MWPLGSLGNGGFSNALSQGISNLPSSVTSNPNFSNALSQFQNFTGGGSGGQGGAGGGLSQIFQMLYGATNGGTTPPSLQYLQSNYPGYANAGAAGGSPYAAPQQSFQQPTAPAQNPFGGFGGQQGSAPNMQNWQQLLQQFQGGGQSNPYLSMLLGQLGQGGGGFGGTGGGMWGGTASGGGGLFGL